MFAFFPLAEADCTNVEGLEVGQALKQDEANKVRKLRVDVACELEDGEAYELMENGKQPLGLLGRCLNDTSGHNKKNMNISSSL